MKKGLTIIELVVAMGIFSIVALIAVGAFITVARTRALTGNIRESQQKIRVAEETITRLARQAYFVRTDPSASPSQWVELYFINPARTSLTSTKFTITGPGGLQSERCASLPITLTNPVCATYDPPQQMLNGSVSLFTGSGFTKHSAGITPKMDLILNGRINGLVGGPYYSDEFNLVTSVLLEGIK